MARKPSVIRHSELLHCLVLDRSTTDDRGRVELVWMYPQVHRVLGFICKIGLMNQQHLAFTLPQIQAMNDKNVWVTGEPTEADLNQLNQLETLLYHEVWSESGARLGKVKDCLFELKTGNISQYLVAIRGWRSVVSELYPLPPSEVLSFGKKRLLVSDRAGEEIQKQQDRIQQTLGGLRQDYQTLKQEVLHFSRRAQTLTQETVQKTVKTVKDLGAQLSEFSETVTELREDLRVPDPLDFPEAPRDWTAAVQQTPDPIRASGGNAAATAAWVEQVKADSAQWIDEFEEDEFQENEFEDGSGEFQENEFEDGSGEFQEDGFEDESGEFQEDGFEDESGEFQEDEVLDELGDNNDFNHDFKDDFNHDLLNHDRGKDQAEFAANRFDNDRNDRNLQDRPEPPELNDSDFLDQEGEDPIATAETSSRSRLEVWDDWE